MWIDKLTDGVLELDTPIGPRYVQPNMMERAYLIWTFRNFFSLPHQVLKPWELRLIDRLLSENRFVSVPATTAPGRPVIGRVEGRVESKADRRVERRAAAAAEVVPIRQPARLKPEICKPICKPTTRKPVSASISAVTEQNPEAASA